MDKPQFVYTLFIATTPEKLWQALTTAEFTQQYWGVTGILLATVMMGQSISAPTYRSKS